MKTIIVRPLIIDCDRPVTLGSIMQCIRRYIVHTIGVDKEVGKLTLNINPHVKSSNNYWQHKELILISLDDKNIQNGEIYYDGHGNLRESGTGNCRNIDSKKIIARQSQISPEYIQQFIEEYNNNNVQDVEIEMEEVIDPDGLSKLNKLEEYRLHPDDLPNCCFILQSKLTNGFINIVERGIIINNIECKKEHLPIPMIYTEAEAKELVWEARKFYQSYKNTPFNTVRMYFNEWFNQNKKK